MDNNNQSGACSREEDDKMPSDLYMGAFVLHFLMEQKDQTGHINDIRNALAWDLQVHPMEVEDFVETAIDGGIALNIFTRDKWHFVKALVQKEVSPRKDLKTLSYIGLLKNPEEFIPPIRQKVNKGTNKRTCKPIAKKNKKPIKRKPLKKQPKKRAAKRCKRETKRKSLRNATKELIRIDLDLEDPECSVNCKNAAQKCRSIGESKSFYNISQNEEENMSINESSDWSDADDTSESDRDELKDRLDRERISSSIKAELDFLDMLFKARDAKRKRRED